MRSPTEAPALSAALPLAEGAGGDYDSSVAFSAISAARRLACLNGMTIGGSFKLYGRHTKGFRVTDLVGKLKAALTLYRQGTEQFMRWGYRRITD